ncbi:MAG: DEAD/DEAH box helicase family protein, partial [Clostridia bacterium]|nr:DEAD/DEAH box helicase family protein [Clostridia bacterium]
MKLKFKKQQYQENAAGAVVKCFEGQSSGNRRDIIDRRHYIANEGTIWEEVIDEDIISFGNKKIELSSEELRKNIRNVQKQNNLDYTDNEEFMNFSIEMETGTGKTYTYIKTMYELNKAYGWSKFIVMTPSIAIREGVLKSFQITEDHFQELYGKKIRYFVYNSNNSSNLSNINNFAEDSNIQVMIINYQAFNTRSKENRKIYEELDELQSRKPIDVIKSTNPILIVDEPQKMGKTEDLLTEFNPLFILRYSATHKKDFKYNMIYRLDAVDSYNQKLVKKINVKGIEILNDKSESTYLYLEGVEISKSDPVARIEMEVKSRTGTGTRKVTKVIKKNDRLYDISGELEQYKDYVVLDIDARNQEYDKVSFTNGVELITGQVIGNAEEDYMARIQIRETIKSHFEKEREYYKKGIKVLSLFFIDEVAKYKVYDENKQAHNGEYAKIFEEEYNNIYNEYYNFIDEDYKKYLDNLRDKKVHSGYFSVDKKASKGLSDDELVYIDSKIDDKKDGTSSDEDAYDLIMKDKERLLSLEEPVRFIFSHSALREGWDNPNIFQICTLKKSNSEISKRQEIGRGLRICVNNSGDRMDYSTLEDDFFGINNLTVIASESYDSFAKSLQKEIAENLTRKSYDMFSVKHFMDKTLKNISGMTKIIDDSAVSQIMMNFQKMHYITESLGITQTLKDAIKSSMLAIPEGFKEFKEEYTNLVGSLYADLKIPIENSGKTNIRQLKPNDNFNKKEFQELWNKINIKTIYEVDFNSQELVNKAVQKLNNELKISKMKVRITEGSQKEAISVNQLKEESAMYSTKMKNEIYDDFVPVTTKYDLIGSIAKDTGLTRHTIIEILSKIEPKVFALYQYNPEEFIRKASNLINEEKATTIIDGIT